jgi:hypothetical protein
LAGSVLSTAVFSAIELTVLQVLYASIDLYEQFLNVGFAGIRGLLASWQH